MASRRNILDQITTVLETKFGSDNVSNRFYTIEDLLKRTNPSTTGSRFPFVNVLLGPGDVDLSLDGQLEDRTFLPVMLVAYEKSQGEDLHLDLVDLLDTIITELTDSANTATFHSNTFAIDRISWVTGEDENRKGIGTLFMDLSITSGESLA